MPAPFSPIRAIPIRACLSRARPISARAVAFAACLVSRPRCWRRHPAAAFIRAARARKRGAPARSRRHCRSAMAVSPPATSRTRPRMPLEAAGAWVEFGGGLLGRHRKAALRGVSMKLPADRPHILAVVGESGSGKTTLTRLLLGLQRPARGRVTFEGRDIAALRGAARMHYRREVQAVFQDPFGAYNPVYRVDRSLTLPPASTESPAPMQKPARSPKPRCKPWACVPRKH